MKKILICCLIVLSFMSGCIKKPRQPRQLKLLDTPELYSFGISLMELNRINDSMAFALDADSKERWEFEKRPSCVVVHKDNDPTLYTVGEGEWQKIGTWKEKGVIYPVIKYHKYDTIELK